MPDKDLTEKQEKTLKDRDATIDRVEKDLGDGFTASELGKAAKDYMDAHRAAEKELTQPDPDPTPKNP